VIVYDRRLTRDEMKYAVLICTLSDERKFVYRDVRRLGTIWLLDEEGWIAYTGGSARAARGDVHAIRVRGPSEGTRTAVKKRSWTSAAGRLGNIYANEALFDARLNPTSQPTTVTR